MLSLHSYGIHGVNFVFHIYSYIYVLSVTYRLPESLGEIFVLRNAYTDAAFDKINLKYNSFSSISGATKTGGFDVVCVIEIRGGGLIHLLRKLKNF